MNTDQIQQLYQKASQAFQGNNFELAEQLFTQLVAFMPHQREFIHALGLIAFRKGDLQLARDKFEQALSLSPNFALAHNHLGAVFFQLKEYDLAKQNFNKAIQLDEQLAEAYYNLGVLFDSLQDEFKAVENYEKEISLLGSYANSYGNLAHLYYKRKNYLKAATNFEFCFQKNPQDIEVGVSAATSYQLALQYDKAAQLLVSLPQNNEVICAKANLLQERGKVEEAIHFYQLLEGKYFREEYYVYYARALCSLNNTQKAASVIEEGYQKYPKSLMLKVMDGLFLPIAYSSQQELEKAREKFSQTLSELESLVDKTEEFKYALLEIFQKRENFFLAYQGKCDKELQQRYANLYIKLISDSQENINTVETTRYSHEKIHIAFISPNFVSHSIGSTTYGFLKYLDKSSFKIHLYLLAPKKADSFTEKMKSEVEVYAYLLPNIEEIQNQILKDEIDVLFLADVGMDPITLNLAMRRLAPVQCTTQGHPVTTGSKYVDYFFSAKDMENEMAHKDYTEKLILLSGQGMAYPKPDLPALPKKQRSDFGIKNTSFVYLSCQSLYKYTPEFDWVYPKIIKNNPESLIVFVGHTHKFINEMFKQRLQLAFEKEGVDFKSHINILPRLSRSDFFDLLRCVDVYLDGLPWSGNNTTLEALGVAELPLVTYPGLQMRHRHSAAHLKKIKTNEGIASSLEDYIQIATRFNVEKTFYDNFKKKISQNKHYLFEDSQPVKEMGDFLVKIMRERGVEPLHPCGR